MADFALTAKLSIFALQKPQNCLEIFDATKIIGFYPNNAKINFERIKKHEMDRT